MMKSEKILRDLARKIDVLCNANSRSFLPAAGSLLYYINHNDILSKVLSSNITSSVNISDIICTTYGAWLQVSLPPNDDDKISFILKFLKINIEKNGAGLTSTLFSIYNKSYIDDNYIKFSEEVVAPCTEVLFDKVQDYLDENFPSQDNISNQSSPVNVTVNGGNVALGNHNIQIVSSNFDVEQFKKDFVSSLIQHDFDIGELAKVSGNIMDFSREMNPSNQDPSKLKKILSSIKSSVSDISQSALKSVATEMLKKYLTNPAIIPSVLGLFH